MLHKTKAQGQHMLNFHFSALIILFSSTALLHHTEAAHAQVHEENSFATRPDPVPPDSTFEQGPLENLGSMQDEIESDLDMLKSLVRDANEQPEESPRNGLSNPSVMDTERQASPPKEVSGGVTSQSSAISNSPMGSVLPGSGEAINHNEVTHNPSPQNPTNFEKLTGQEPQGALLAAAPQTSRETPRTLFEKEQRQGEADLWKTAAAVFGVLLLISLGAAQLIRSRRDHASSSALQKAKALQLVATLPIGHKRQIHLIKIRNSEVAIASTESGISVISELATRVPVSLPSSPASPKGAAKAQVTDLSQPLLHSAPSADESKSEILKRALETIENRRVSNKPPQEGSRAPQRSHEPDARAASQLLPGNHAPVNSTAPLQRARSTLTKDPRKTPAPSSTIPPGRPMQKILAAKYGKNAGQETDSQNNERLENDNADPHTDNVARLIREKLKQMKTIN